MEPRPMVARRLVTIVAYSGNRLQKQPRNSICWQEVGHTDHAAEDASVTADPQAAADWLAGPCLLPLLMGRTSGGGRGGCCLSAGRWPLCCLLTSLCLHARGQPASCLAVEEGVQ